MKNVSFLTRAEDRCGKTSHCANASRWGRQCRHHRPLRRLLTEWPQLGIVVALIATVLVFTAIDKDFFSGYNFVNIFLQSSITAILAIGETLVIVTAGIDLSIGSALALAAVVAGLLMKAGVSLPFAVLGSLLTGAAAGLLNGALITLTGITPFVVTLGTMSIFSGWPSIVSGGQTVYGLPSGFNDLFAGSAGPSQFRSLSR